MQPVAAVTVLVVYQVPRHLVTVAGTQYTLQLAGRVQRYDHARHQEHGPAVVPGPMPVICLRGNWSPIGHRDELGQTTGCSCSRESTFKAAGGEAELHLQAFVERESTTKGGQHIRLRHTGIAPQADPWNSCLQGPLPQIAGLHGTYHWG